jgi:hypothetical protein
MGGSDVFFRHCEERSDEAIQNISAEASLGCFASLAMTIRANNTRLPVDNASAIIEA